MGARADSVDSKRQHLPHNKRSRPMNTFVTQRQEPIATHKDAVACVAVLATAVMVLVTGAMNVYHQNALQQQQAQRVSQEA
jgi:hypothetical protein